MAGYYDPGFDPDHPNEDDPYYGPTAEPPEAGAPTPTPAPTSTPGHTTLSPQQYVEAWRQQHPNLKLNQANSQAAWDQLVKDMKAVGFNVGLDSRPDGMHKGINLDGAFVKLADGNDNAIWLPGGDAPSAAAGAFEKFDYPDWVPPSWDAKPYDAPAPFQYADYQPLTAETFRADPGYEFARSEGLRAPTNAASAKGLLRTGGFAKGLAAYAGGLADQEFGNVEARNLRNYQVNRGNQADIYDRNYKNNLTDWMTGYNTEADEFNRSQQVYGTNFGTKATSQGINADALNSLFSHQLSLYDIATRDLPKYTPPTTNAPAYGYPN